MSSVVGRGGRERDKKVLDYCGEFRNFKDCRCTQRFRRGKLVTECYMVPLYSVRGEVGKFA